MYLCQEGYPCVYLKRTGINKCTCSLPICPVYRKGDKVYDQFTKEVRTFVIRIPKEPKEEPEKKKSRKNSVSRREIRQIMNANAYERRGGKVRQVRHSSD